MDQLEISGSHAAELLNFITQELDDATLDHVEIDREFADSSGSAK
ncbi:MAG TPA: hypothetical protein VN924_21415 [Bryobacteraceae bacterium]|jgi:hypothetical protein|nr:hypothetical protein [Bryobacteraceae bacterium]